MAQGRRVKLSAAQKMDLWCRWKAGQSLHTIGRAFGKPHNSIHGFLSHHGGIVPAARRRPAQPWQRGTNENTKRLLRQYLPKRTDLSGYTQSELDKIALRPNQRPRKTLGFHTPASKLRASVAPTR